MELLTEQLSKDDLKFYIQEFYKFALENLKQMNRKVTVILKDDEANADDFFGKTGYYNPDEEEIILFITNRHPKDIIRSFAHELIHHEQNCRGDYLNLNLGMTATDPAYALHDDGLREMEREAFERGNMLFRYWCDIKKLEIRGENIMSENKSLEEVLLQKVIKRLVSEAGMPMKTDSEDVDGDGNKEEKVPAFLDKGDVKKKKGSGKVPKQLQKFVKGKGKEQGKESEEEESEEEELKESFQHPYPELFQKKNRLNNERFSKHENLIYEELLKRAIKK